MHQLHCFRYRARLDWQPRVATQLSEHALAARNARIRRARAQARTRTRARARVRVTLLKNASRSPFLCFSIFGVTPSCKSACEFPWSLILQTISLFILSDLWHACVYNLYHSCLHAGSSNLSLSFAIDVECIPRSEFLLCKCMIYYRCLSLRIR